jgi:hypothetical protein
LLEETETTNDQINTFGLRINGSINLGEMNGSYLLEFSKQDFKSGPTRYDANYYVLEAGLTMANITAKLGYEVLGSDDGLYGFSTPLATGHAFNGWADIFLQTPSQGIEDIYLNLSANIAGATLTVVYHDYSANKSVSNTDNLGSEINLLFTKPISDNYTVGIKYANYENASFAAKPDNQKLWFWFQASF